jgi:ankyrin repeat protein
MDTTLIIIIVISVLILSGGIFGFITYNKNQKLAKIKKANELLINSSENGNVEKFQQAIDDGAQLDYRKGGNNSIMIASKKGYIEIVKKCLDLMSPNFKLINSSSYNNSYTPLMFAAENNKIDIVELLLNKKKNGKIICDVNRTAVNNETALTLAIKYDNHKIAKILLNLNTIIDLNKQIKSGDTPLFLAIKKKNNDISKAIINIDCQQSFEDCDLNLVYKDKDNNTALYLALNDNNTEIVKLLINKFENLSKNTDPSHHMHDFYSKNVYESIQVGDKTFYEIASLKKNSEIINLFKTTFTPYLYKNIYNAIDLLNTNKKFTKDVIDIIKLQIRHGYDINTVIETKSNTSKLDDNITDILTLIILKLLILDKSDGNDDLFIETLKYLVSIHIDYNKNIILDGFFNELGFGKTYGLTDPVKLNGTNVSINILILMILIGDNKKIVEYLLLLNENLSFDKIDFNQFSIDDKWSYKGFKCDALVLLVIMSDDIDLFKILYNQKNRNKEEIIKYKDKDGVERSTTLFKIAIYEGRLKIFEEIKNNTSLSYQFNETDKDSIFGQSALNIATAGDNYKHHDTVKKIDEREKILNEIKPLYLKKLNMDEKFNSGIIEGNIDDLKEAIEYFNYDINMKINENIEGEETTMLHLAIANGHINIVKYLFENGFENVNQIGYISTLPGLKLTPLNVALLTNNDIIAEYLLSIENIDVNHKLYTELEGNIFGMSYISTCLSYDYMKPIEMIINNKNYNIDTNVDDLTHAINSKNMHIIELLLKKGINPNTKSAFTGVSAIELAKEKDDVNMINLITPYLNVEQFEDYNNYKNNIDDNFFLSKNIHPKYYNIFLED